MIALATSTEYACESPQYSSKMVARSNLTFNKMGRSHRRAGDDEAVGNRNVKNAEDAGD
jgi:hypothetical protein